MSEGETKEPVKPVKYITEKGPGFRTFHADGVWGLLSGPTGINLEFYTEHQPLPKFVIQQTTGEFSQDVASDPDCFLVTRDFQAEVVLTLPAAVQLHALLQSFISMHESEAAALNPKPLKPQP